MESRVSVVAWANLNGMIKTIDGIKVAIFRANIRLLFVAVNLETSVHLAGACAPRTKQVKSVMARVLATLSSVRVHAQAALQAVNAP